MSAKANATHRGSSDQVHCGIVCNFDIIPFSWYYISMDYIISTEYDGKNRKLFPKNCKRCNKQFYVPKHVWNQRQYCSQGCGKVKDLIALCCAFCNKSFERKPSSLVNSKSGLYFCSRECKEQAQSISGGDKFVSLRPEHYDTGVSTYRKKALKHLPNSCIYCGYDKYIEVLEVHHKDQDRKNGQLDNLEIVCANCHLALHYGLLV